METRADDREKGPARGELTMENSHRIPPLQILGLLANDGAFKIFQVPPLLAAHDSGLQAKAISRCPKKKKQGLGLFLKPDR